MIKISNLNKIYKSKKRSKCHALKNINLTLPDTGLIFVLGKSGSGKSTLLNLIGGLDNITSGSIEVDGNNLANFKERDFCNYRNTHIGFIFQDYHLIDELTVYENIVLSLNLKQTEVEDQVKQALEMVDLAGYENRYPTELSGGEQQRIAIARAIVKNPRIILADEPTGNLDTNTATAIITLLKELSKKCLILIVSHNLNDANGYADRIIELKKGEVIYDKSRNPEFLDEMSLSDGELIYPQGLALSDRDIAFINQNKGADFVKRTDKFLPTVATDIATRKTKIDNKHLKFGKQLHLSGIFLKNKASAISVSSFMVAVIMVIMALAQTIISFDSGAIITEEMVKTSQDSLLLNKSLDPEIQLQLDATYYVKINDQDVQTFYDNGYQGKIYKGLTYAIPISSSSIMQGRKGYILRDSVFVTQTLGTLIVDEDFLESKFGEIKYCARRAEFHPQGLIITDYVADAILQTNSNYRNKDYDDLIRYGYVLSSSSQNRFIINGIIKTGYQDTHKNLIEKMSNQKGKVSVNELYTDPDFSFFSTDVYDRLGYSYTLNSNFLEDYIEAESSDSPNFFKMEFNKLVSLSNTSANIKKISDNGTKVWDGWTYTETPPAIPEGAKYIQVAYYSPRINAYTGLYYEEKQDYPILVFNHDEPIGRDQLFYHSGYSLNFCGELRITNSGYVVSDYIEIPENAEITKFFTLTHNNQVYCAFYDAEKNIISSETSNKDSIETPNTILLPAVVYEKLFSESIEKLGDDWVDKVKPQKMKLAHYTLYDVEKKNPLFEKTVYVGVHSGSSILMSDDLFSLFYKDSVFEHALYLDGIDGIGAVLDTSERIHYTPQSYTVEGVHTMTKAVDVFIPIFELVAIFLCVGVIFIMVNFSSRMIQDKMHEIGILKALGVKNHSICSIFGMQVLLIAVLTCFLATAGYYVFIGTANDILINSLKELAPSHVVLDLDFLEFHSSISVFNCILVFALSVLSLIFPMIKIKMIKPVKIIKAKE